MKKFMFLTLFLSCGLLANAQDYLEKAEACFNKGDYECAAINYKLFGTMTGEDMSAYIQRAEECRRIRNSADDCFRNKEYGKARDYYKSLSEKNPKDSYAKNQYRSCAAKLKPGNYTETAKSLKMEMIYVPGGTYTMGCSSEQDNDCRDNEMPVHRVTVGGFYIGKYEVTQAQWKAIMGTTVRQQQAKAEANSIVSEGDNYPMCYVSWNEVREFIRKLNAQSSRQYRLPTEAEWEYAARGGNRSRDYKYSGSNNADNVAWNGDNSDNKSHIVGTKSPNELGIYDMSGNIAEWCSDWYGSYFGNSQTNPKGSASGTGRVGRGGSWGDDALDTRVRDRISVTPNRRGNFLGFRLVCSP